MLAQFGIGLRVEPDHERVGSGANIGKCSRKNACTCPDSFIGMNALDTGRNLLAEKF
jgi:hypothetical protein